MVEYERPLGYSMPLAHGLYPPPPYHYQKMRSMVALFQTDIETKRKFLPKDFEPMNLFDAIFIVEYPNSSIGPYNENLILLSCTYKNKPGLFTSNIYVDSDIALAAGRELWGYPKKMCQIELSEVQDNKIVGSLTRMGVKFLEVESEVGKLAPGMDIKGLIGTLPIYNVKQIPNIDGSQNPALRQITETVLGIGEVYTNLGCKTNYIKSKFSEHDLCHELVNDAKKDLGGFYIIADMTLPPGKVLE